LSETRATAVDERIVALFYYSWLLLLLLLLQHLKRKTHTQLLFRFYCYCKISMVVSNNASEVLLLHNIRFVGGRPKRHRR